MIEAIMRFYSYIFHALISLVFLAPAVLASMSGLHTLQTPFLPWSGKQLTNYMLAIGLFALISLLLAIKGKLRVLFVLWTLAFTVIVFRGIFLSPLSFSGVSDFRWALFFLLGTVATIIGAVSRMRMKTSAR